ncbi:MAG: hypothetical protein AAGC93_31455 [Cyanobacteria bacterium P01_F01_bin.53]
MRTSKQLSPDYEAALAALAPYLKDVVAEVAEDAAVIRQELAASEPETLLTQLTDVTQELLELVEILASRPLTRGQLQTLGRLEVTANNAIFQAKDFCESFET